MQGWNQRILLGGPKRLSAGLSLGLSLAAGTLALALCASPAVARPAPVDLLDGGFYDSSPAVHGAPNAALSGLPYLECVPYARKVSGIDIRGDALTWWDQAAGRYARGYRPRVGAVMSFRPYGPMQLGHVAAVSRVVDSRTVLLRHANWSPIDGRRGQIEDDVRAVDVSPDNDWSAVRVWYAPLGDLGTTHWPVNGFIYNRPPEREDRLAAISRPAPAPMRAQAPEARPVRTVLAASYQAAPSRIGADFLRGIVPETPVAPVQPPRLTVARVGKPAAGSASAPSQLPGRIATATPLRDDPIGRIIASRVAITNR